jgi:protoheme IX farnesyltransferase
MSAGSSNPTASKAVSLPDAAFASPMPGLSLAEPADYFALMKPRVMSLVVFTAMAGLICAPGQMHPFLAVVSVLCIAVGAGAAGALNMWYDRDIDAVMSRTKKRPLPQGKMTGSSVLVFGVILSAFSILGLALASNYYAAGLLAFTIFFYVFIYTMWLKRSTPQNIVIGGAAGAFPPMIGWAAAAGGSMSDQVSFAMLANAVTVESIALFLIIFLWTPPHFWALALYKQGDYGKAGVPMMPNVKGAKSTRLQIFVYAVLLAAASGLVAVTGLSSPLFIGGAIVLNSAFLALSYKVWRSKAGDKPADQNEASLYEVRAGDKAARNLFAYSIIYLFALFLVLAASQLIGGGA